MRGRNDLEAEGRRAAPEGIDAALPLLFFIVLLALVDEGFAPREHEVHHAGEFVGDGGIGTGLVHAAAQAAVERAESLRDRLMAASLSAWRTRLVERRVRALSTLPPLTLVPGRSPSHEQKCLTLAKRLRIEALLAPLGRHEVKLDGPGKRRGKNTPQFDARTALARWAGDLTRINGLAVTTVMTILSEIGPDPDR